jgi:hypothetical protein
VRATQLRAWRGNVARQAISMIAQRDHIDHACGTLAALDFNHDVIVHAQAIGRDVLCFGDAGSASDTRAGRDGGVIADPQP